MYIRATVAGHSKIMTFNSNVQVISIAKFVVKVCIFTILEILRTLQEPAPVRSCLSHEISMMFLLGKLNIKYQFDIKNSTNVLVFWASYNVIEYSIVKEYKKL